jgi:hypothetical protein
VGPGKNILAKVKKVLTQGSKKDILIKPLAMNQLIGQGGHEMTARETWKLHSAEI